MHVEDYHGNIRFINRQILLEVGKTHGWTLPEGKTPQELNWDLDRIYAAFLRGSQNLTTDVSDIWFARNGAILKELIASFFADPYTTLKNDYNFFVFGQKPLFGAFLHSTPERLFQSFSQDKGSENNAGEIPLPPPGVDYRLFTYRFFKLHPEIKKACTAHYTVEIADLAAAIAFDRNASLRGLDRLTIDRETETASLKRWFDAYDIAVREGNADLIAFMEQEEPTGQALMRLADPERAPTVSPIRESKKPADVPVAVEQPTSPAASLESFGFFHEFNTDWLATLKAKSIETVDQLALELAVLGDALDPDASAKIISIQLATWLNRFDRCERVKQQALLQSGLAERIFIATGTTKVPPESAEPTDPLVVLLVEKFRHLGHYISKHKLSGFDQIHRRLPADSGISEQGFRRMAEEIVGLAHPYDTETGQLRIEAKLLAYAIAPERTASELYRDYVEARHKFRTQPNSKRSFAELMVEYSPNLRTRGGDKIVSPEAFARSCLQRIKFLYPYDANKVSATCVPLSRLFMGQIPLTHVGDVRSSVLFAMQLLKIPVSRVVDAAPELRGRFLLSSMVETQMPELAERMFRKRCCTIKQLRNLASPNELAACRRAGRLLALETKKAFFAGLKKDEPTRKLLERVFGEEFFVSPANPKVLEVATANETHLVLPRPDNRASSDFGLGTFFGSTAP